jgi:hypothetical protein
MDVRIRYEETPSHVHIPRPSRRLKDPSPVRRELRTDSNPAQREGEDHERHPELS